MVETSGQLIILVAGGDVVAEIESYALSVVIVGEVD